MLLLLPFARTSRCNVFHPFGFCILCDTALSLVPCFLVCSQILQFFGWMFWGTLFDVEIITEHTLYLLYALIVHRIVCLRVCEFVF